MPTNTDKSGNSGGADKQGGTGESSRGGQKATYGSTVSPEVAEGQREANDAES